MRKTQVNKRAASLFAYMVACAGLLGVLLVQTSCASEPKRENNVAVSGERILPDQVNLANLEAFEEQMRHDLPVGTAKKDVETYLNRWRIRYGFIDSAPIYGPDGNSFHAVLENIGKRSIFTARLSIWIRLGENEEVREIDFRVTYL